MRMIKLTVTHLMFVEKMPLVEFTARPTIHATKMVMVILKMDSWLKKAKKLKRLGVRRRLTRRSDREWRGCGGGAE